MSHKYSFDPRGSTTYTSYCDVSAGVALAVMKHLCDIDRLQLTNGRDSDVTWFQIRVGIVRRHAWSRLNNSHEPLKEDICFGKHNAVFQPRFSCWPSCSPQAASQVQFPRTHFSSSPSTESGSRPAAIQPIRTAHSAHRARAPRPVYSMHPPGHSPRRTMLRC